MAVGETKKYPIKHIFCEIFKTNIYVSYGVPFDVWRKQLKKQLNIDISDQENSDGMAICVDTKRDAINWIWTARKDPSILAHEAMHATANILLKKGITLTLEGDEIYAYYLQFIMSKTLG
jgi:hypothetical protein